MLSDDTLRQLIHDRRSDREREAEAARLALEAQALRTLPRERPTHAALLGHFLVARRHVLR